MVNKKSEMRDVLGTRMTSNLALVAEGHNSIVAGVSSIRELPTFFGSGLGGERVKNQP
jgi:hypothetical protein